MTENNSDKIEKPFANRLNPLSREYNQGVYRYYQFNETDWNRRKSGLIAQEFISAEDISSYLINLARNPPIHFEIIPASMVIEDIETDSYLIYVPLPAQSQPKLTE
jgi:hypothetical protein